MTPSINQEAIYSAFTSTQSNLLIEAVAGSGKTITLLGILRLAEYRTLFLAFNKSIQEDIQKKIEDNNLVNGKAMTIHSLGLSSLTATYGQKNINVNENKKWDLIKYLEKTNRRLYKGLIWEDKAKVNITLMEMNDISRLFMTDNIKEIFTYMADMDKFYFEHNSIKELWQEFILIREQTYSAQKKEIDFIDMIYLPVRDSLVIPICPYYLMIDESLSI